MRLGCGMMVRLWNRHLRVVEGSRGCHSGGGINSIHLTLNHPLKISSVVQLYRNGFSWNDVGGELNLRRVLIMARIQLYPDYSISISNGGTALGYVPSLILMRLWLESPEEKPLHGTRDHHQILICVA